LSYKGLYDVTQRNNLYRRPSGIYVLRITIPVRYRAQLGQREIHASTRTTDQSAAKAVACRLLDHWNTYLSELEMGQSGLTEACKISMSKAVISVGELSAASGLQVEHVLRELLNNNVPIVYEANAQPGFLVSDLTEVDRESDSGGFVLNSAFEIGTPHAFSRFLKPFNARHTLLSIIETGFSEEVVFRIPGQKQEAAFFDLPGVRLTARSVLLLQVHAERFFREALSRAVSSSSTPPAFSVRIDDKTSTLPCDCCKPARAEELVSTLMATFLLRKQPSWKLEQQKKMETLCGTFVDLMNNPPLGALSRQMMWDYDKKLRKMPANRHDAARRHGTNDAHRLLALAEEHDEPRLSSASVERYLEALSSMFAWADRNQILTDNPAERINDKTKKTTRAQDDRSQFDKTDLDKIFSVFWFQTGAGERNKQGRFHQFRPHFYWLPLLGLYTGARLNELSQLYIDDVRTTESGVLYLDFNLDGADKVDADAVAFAPDKSLKTVNSKRIVAVHPHLIELGLPGYVKALSDAGYSRLFPELKRDAIKGYGKPAGNWFNERFLGKQLGIPRDGKRTFHSFRHTFITALSELEVPPDIQAQLAGHSRGNTIAATRYRKDAEAERLLTYVERLDFKLSTIAPFSISDGLDAVKHGLMRKAKP